MKKAHSSAAAGGESPQRKISPLFFPVTVPQPTLFRDDGLTVPPFPFGSSSHVVGRVETSRVGEPWDLLRGRCVFRDRETLLNAVSEADLSHWAPNCATFSRAREIPLPGIKNAPRPVRDEASPEGIPAELEKMSGRARKKLEDDTEMADLSARTCLQRHRAGKWFSLEHPGRSLALHLKSWRELQAEPGVMKLEYTTCMYEGSRRRKRQMLLCNHDSFIPMSKVCNGNRMCERTGLPHLKWKPTTSGGRVIQFTTGDEREYPQGFCEQYAECCKDVLKEKGTFVEIFSGPNAPLSAAVCKAFGESLKGGRLETNRGVKQELQRIAQVVENSTKLARPESRPLQIAEVPDGRVSRLNMLESGKQPGYGKRNQLIPDGLNCTKQHLNQALKLEHPFNSMMSLKWDHAEVLQDQITCPRITNEHRLRVLANWRSLAKDPAVQELQREHNATACKNAAKLGLRPKTALMQELGKKYGVEDKDVPLLCLQGMPIVGPALESPFFERHEIPAEISVRELLASSKQRRQHALKRVEYMAKLGTPEQAVAIYTKTLKEVSKGTMDGPFTHEELVQKFGNHYNVIPSFGLEQGTDEAGQPNYRVALRLMDHIAQVAPNRVCSLGGTSPPTILYTDASDVPGRDPRYGIGGVLIIQHPTFSIQYFSASVPQSIVDSWYPRATYMGQLEALAAPVSLSTWRHQLKNRQIIHFIDNDAVASSLVKGYSPKADSTWIINEYWSLAAAIGADIYIDRVESKSNLADGPSRFTTHELDSMGARPISPVFSSFHSSPIYNIFREECCAPARTVPVVTTNTT